jgi:biopolymer transport protein ExbB
MLWKSLRAVVAVACGLGVILAATTYAVAQNSPPTVPAVGTATLPRDLSPWGMFVNADIVVQTVMVGLVIASLVTWTVWLAKALELAAAKRRARKGLAVLAGAQTLAEANEQLRDERDAVTRLVRTAIDEMRTSDEAGAESLKERIAWLLERLEIGAGRRMGRGMGALATIGATAPFVGLFGTVWGIMNSFIGISTAHTTNLAVVAPGIAEALLATALGLFAAIPAVVIYNVFARSIGSYRAQLADAGALVMRLVSRDCERAERLSISLARAAE